MYITFAKTNHTNTYEVLFHDYDGKTYVAGHVGRDDDGTWWAAHLANFRWMDAGLGYRTRREAANRIMKIEETRRSW